MQEINNKSSYKLSFIAQFLEGNLIGYDCEISDLTDIETDKPRSIAVEHSFSNEKKYNDLALAAIVFPEEYCNIGINKPIITVKNTKIALKKLIDLFYPEESIENEISKTSFISSKSILASPIYVGNFVTIRENTKIGKYTYIENNVYIGKNVTIGEHVRIYASAVICDNTIIGNNVIVYQSAVIGSEGFGYVNTTSGHLKIRQVGNVVIEDDVEVGANTCIDRATLSSTIIGKGTKIDNLVQIGHNVKIGQHCIIVAEAGIAGSCIIGNNVLIGGQVGIADHAIIPDNTILASKTGVIGSLKKSGIYAGYPAQEHMLWLKNMSALKELNEMKKKLNILWTESKR